jgi:hypothetical protein
MIALVVLSPQRNTAFATAVLATRPRASARVEYAVSCSVVEVVHKKISVVLNPELRNN